MRDRSSALPAVACSWFNLASMASRCRASAHASADLGAAVNVADSSPQNLPMSSPGLIAAGILLGSRCNGSSFLLGNRGRRARSRPAPISSGQKI